MQVFEKERADAAAAACCREHACAPRCAAADDDPHAVRRELFNYFMAARRCDKEDARRKTMAQRVRKKCVFAQGTGCVRRDHQHHHIIR